MAPVAGDRDLRSTKREPPVTYLGVKRVLNRVLRVRDPARFRPQIPRIVARPAQFERDEVVVFVTAGRPPITVGRKASCLLWLGHGLRRPDRLGVSAPADRLRDIRLGHGRIDRAWSASRVRQREGSRSTSPTRARRRLRLDDVGTGDARGENGRRAARRGPRPPVDRPVNDSAPWCGSARVVRRRGRRRGRLGHGGGSARRPTSAANHAYR
jgi:hypothetical protein